MIWLVVLAAFFLAFANGANDNSKGVATLIGSGTMPMRRAIILAAIATMAGSAAAIFFAQELVKRFGGKGLVDASLAGTTPFVLVVGVGAAATVLLATRIRMPISTTHAMVGGIVGTGLAAGGVHWPQLWRAFVVPLLFAPLFGLVLAAVLYSVLRWTRARMGITRETCLCVGEASYPVTVGVDGSLLSIAGPISIREASVSECRQRYSGRVVGLEAQRTLDFLHTLSAAAASFARGMNDTPKIAALLIAAGALSLKPSMAVTGVAIALGGLLAVRRVAETMSMKITAMNDGQAFSANLVTAFCVLVASKLGLPVSTTHVSCGSLFGIGVVNGQARWNMIAKVLVAWLTTLPAAAALSYVAWQFLGR